MMMKLLNTPNWLLTVEWSIDGKSYSGVVDRLVQAPGQKNIGLRVEGFDGEAYFVNPIWLTVVAANPVYPRETPAPSDVKLRRRQREVRIIPGRRWLKEWLDLAEQRKREAVISREV